MYKRQAQVSGLYIDDKFEGSVESRAELDAVLNDILSSYRNGSADERAEFIQKVQVVDGLYPISSIVSAADMKAYLARETVVAKHYTCLLYTSCSRRASPACS